MEKIKQTLKNLLCLLLLIGLVASDSLEFLKTEKKDKFRNLGSTNCVAKIEKSGNVIIKCEKEGEKNAFDNENISKITEKMKNEDILKFMQLGKIAKENNKIGINKSKIFDLDSLRKNQEIIIQLLMMPYAKKKEIAKENRNFLFQENLNESEKEEKENIKSELKALPGKANKTNEYDYVVENTESFSFFHSKEM